MQRTVDDLDGISPAETYKIGISGYEVYVDLSYENYQALVNAVAHFFKAGRPTRTNVPVPHPALAPASEEGAAPAVTTIPIVASNKVIREWWEKNAGKKGLPDYYSRGVIPPLVREAFDKAHQPT